MHIPIATASSIENICKTEINTDYKNNFNYIISFDEGKEVYTFAGLEITENTTNERLTPEESTNIIYNLTCVVGKQRFTKLEYIIPGTNTNMPEQRTLIFYNDKKNYKKISIIIIIFLIILSFLILYYFK